MKPVFTYTPAIRNGLESFLKTKRAVIEPSMKWQADFLDRLLSFTTTGKLLRGSLVCFTYEAFAQKPVSKSVIRAATALELAHSGLLIHDDIMDNDKLRRGQPSFHEQYRSLGAHERLGQIDRFGTNMAMCAGDAALFLLFELLVGCPATAVQLFTNQLVTTCAGQMEDLYLESVQVSPSKQAIYDLMETKTAAYTIALPLILGASLAGQSGKILRQLEDIGIKAGVIFQIRDDELGVMGDTKHTGKPVGSDIIEGKRTLLRHHLLEACSLAERQKAEAIFGNPNAVQKDISYVQALVSRYNITTLLNHEIDTLEAQAKRIINELSVPEKTKKTLVELIDFCDQRQS